MQLKVQEWNDYYQPEHLNGRLSVYYTHNQTYQNFFAADVLKGLSSKPKFLHSKYFYDNTGSELFEKICSAPEYYLTRTESSILMEYSDDIICNAKGAHSLIELGSGSSMKTRFLINSFIKSNEYLHYFPIDVSSILIQSSYAVLDDFIDLRISGIISEYEKGIELVYYLNSEPKLIIFLGSSIGNFSILEAKKFIKRIADKMKTGDFLLLGFDMVKDKKVLHDAYNDNSGITAEFNLNLLQRINNELGGNFEKEAFEHRAFFNESRSRIEMHLVSKRYQKVSIKEINKVFWFRKGESIHTENSYKFTDGLIHNITGYAGLELSKKWSDERSYFSTCLFKKT